MATLKETDTLKGLDAVDAAMDRVLEFYLANGYRLSEQVKPADDARADSDRPAAHTSLRFTRGKAGNGWWTSDMTELYTRVRAAREDACIVLDYEVETTGQILAEDERTFWQREREAASRYVRGEKDTPEDLRSREAARAKKVSGEFLSKGIWGAVAIFMIIIFLGFLGII